MTHRDDPNAPPTTPPAAPSPAERGNPWRRLSTQRFYESFYLAMEEDAVRHRSGREHPYTAVRFRIHGIAAVPILADGSTCLVGQYRYLSERYTWEVPRGAGEKTVPALETAQRELAEETGLHGGSWMELLDLMVSPGITDERAPCFVAWDLEERAPIDLPGEELAIRRLPFREAVGAALDGTICDAASVSSLLALNARLLRGDLPPGLLAALATQR